MSKLVLLRHGQSIWNLENRFTGWVDVDLTKTGELEAESVAKKLINIKFGLLCTSMLIRAIRTSFIILKNLIASNH